MAPATVFRSLRPADAAECARLHGQAFTPGWTAADLHEQLSRVDRVATGAVRREPTLAGFAISRAVSGEADLLTIVVDRATRHGGVGSGLLARHLSALANAHVRTVLLEVEATNTAARALYAKFGFTPVGGRKGYYGAGRADALVLRLDL